MGGQVARFLLVGAVLVLTLRGAWPGLMAALEQPWPGWLGSAGVVVRQAMGRVAVALLVAGVVDYGLQWRKWRMRLSSTPQEHREEQKALEGDPGGRSRRRRTAKAMMGLGSETEGVKEIGAGGVGRV
jgi:flagellar biosynthetic protein FlhB